jgi:hypothetical protein
MVFLVLGALIVAPRPSAHSVAAQGLPRTAPAQTLSGMEALRYLHARREFAKAEQYAYGILWENIRQPEALWLLGDSLFKQKKTEDAAAFLTMLLQVWQEDGLPNQQKEYKRQAERVLTSVNKKFDQEKAAYAQKAPGKQFESAEKVDDLWMTQVKADLAPLHGLYAWKLVGGRKDKKPDWIHNRQGSMHRSGLKYVEEVDGRKGVLFGVPLKLEHARTQKLGHAPRVTMVNSGKCAFLRVGIKGYNFPFVLKVQAAGRELFSRQIGPAAWSDLKIELGDAAGKAEPVILELTVPATQGPFEGVWLDYVDFFDN